MALSSSIIGMHFRYPDFYEVGREKIREYAVAVKNDDPAYFDETAAADLGHDSLPAPLTFISVFGYQAQDLIAWVPASVIAVKIRTIDTVC